MAETKAETKPAPVVPPLKKQLSVAEELALAVKERKPCSGTFRIGAGKHYRAGRLYEPGELITIEDEVPGKGWEPFDPNAKATPAVPPPAPKASNLDL